LIIDRRTYSVSNKLQSRIEGRKGRKRAQEERRGGAEGTEGFDHTVLYAED